MNSPRKSGLLTLVLALGLLPLLGRAADWKDIEYGRVGDVPLLLDVHVPETPGAHPVAILVHGGGWSAGDKAGSDKPGNGGDITPWFSLFSDAGCTWFSINYRLAPKDRWPAQIEDVDTAIRWVKAHAAEYRGDPRRIVLVGHSAGGHLVMFAATQPERDLQVQAVIGFAPVTDLVSDSERRGGVSPSLQNLFGVVKEITGDTRAKLAEVSPLNHVHGGMPPILIVHGDADRTVPLQQTTAFVARLKENDVPVELIVRKGAPHSLVEGEKIDSKYREPLLQWLNRTLGAGSAAKGANSK
jgi:alpha-L-fucosidase 2